MSMGSMLLFFLVPQGGKKFHLLGEFFDASSWCLV